MILPKCLRSKAYDIMKVLLREKHIIFNENYIITHLKIGMNIPIQKFFGGIFVMKSNVKEYEVFFLNDITNSANKEP